MFDNEQMMIDERMNSSGLVSSLGLWQPDQDGYVCGYLSDQDH